MKVTILKVLFTLLISFLSLLGVVIFSKFFGINMQALKNPETTLNLSSTVVVLAILIFPILITYFSEKFLHKNSGFLKNYFSVWSLNSFIKYLLLGFLLKLVATSAAYLLSTGATFRCAVAGLNRSWFVYFLWFLVALILNSINEELIYRAYPIKNLVKFKQLNPLLIVFFFAIVFSLMHFLIEEPDLGRFGYRTAFGLLAGIVFLRNRSTMDIVALHTGWNFSALSFSGDTDWRIGGVINTIGVVDSTEKLVNIVVLFSAFLFIQTSSWQRVRWF